MALMALLASSLTTVLASGATWYVVALGKTPFGVKTLDEHITRLEKDLAQEALKDEKDREDITMIKSQITDIDNKLELIYSSIVNEARRTYR